MTRRDSIRSGTKCPSNVVHRNSTNAETVGAALESALWRERRRMLVVSFGVIFSDFTYGMFRADPAVLHAAPSCVPEPATLTISCCATAIVLLRHRWSSRSKHLMCM